MSIKLSYFDARGLCEPIRMILAYGGEEYEDFRFPLTKIPAIVPPEVKEKCTWGTVPLLEMDGRKLNQSLAIARYFAKKHKLVGKDDFEAALCDEYVDSCREIFTALFPVYIEQEADKKAKLKEEVMKKLEDKYLKAFNTLIKSNGGKHLVGKGLTWADIQMAYLVDTTQTIAGFNLAKNHPQIQSLCDAVFAEPKMKAWVDKRPKTMF